MGVTTTVMNMVKAMNVTERMEFSKQFFDFIKDQPEFKPFFEKAKTTTTPSRSRRGGGKKRPYSVKLVTGVDKSKPKIQQVDGQWVNIDKDKIEENAIYLVTARLEDGTTNYHICKGVKSYSHTFETYDGDFTFDGLAEQIEPLKKWAEAVDVLEDYLAF